MSITTDLKKYADAALEQGKTAAAESAKPLYAVVGAGDLAVEQAKALAAKATERAEELRTVVTDRIALYRSELEKAATEVGDKAQELPSALRKFDVTDVRKNVEKAASEYSSQALGLYAHLSKRGEEIVESLSKDVRNQPAVKKVVEVAGDATETAQTLVNRGQKIAKNTVAEAAEAVAEGAEAVELEVAPAKVGARKAAATRAARKSAPAATKAPRKTTARKAPVKKAAAAAK